MLTANNQRSVNSHYDINNTFRIINTATVTVLGSQDNIFPHIYAYMTIKQNKSKKESTKQLAVNNRHNLELLLGLQCFLWKIKQQRLL